MPAAVTVTDVITPEPLLANVAVAPDPPVPILSNTNSLFAVLSYPVPPETIFAVSDNKPKSVFKTEVEAFVIDTFP